MQPEENKEKEIEEEEVKKSDPEPHVETLGDKLKDFVKPFYMKVILSFLVGFLLLWVILSMCSSPAKTAQRHYDIGIDSTWYPLDIKLKERNYTLFSESLLRKIIQGSNIQIKITQVPTENLFPELYSGDYDGIISALRSKPTAFRSTAYIHSTPIYRLGPVLVINSQNHYQTLDDMGGKVVGLVGETRFGINLDNYPAVIFTGYPDIAKAFLDLSNGQLDGVIVDALKAKIFAFGLYSNMFRIADFLLDDEGIRLIMSKTKDSEEFLKFFNQRLEEFRKDGTYDELLKTWRILPES